MSADSSESLDVQISKPSLRPMVRAGPSLSIAGFILNEIKVRISSIMWTGPTLEVKQKACISRATTCGHFDLQ